MESTMRRRLASCSLLALLIGAALPASALRPKANSDTQEYLVDMPGVATDRPLTPIMPTEEVDVLSGALTIQQPLWSPPQKGQLALSVMLGYSSKAWDEREWGPCPEGQPGYEPPPRNRVVRARKSWVAPGFTLTLGVIAQGILFQDEYAWHYIDPTGGRHRLYIEAALPATTYVTRDGSYVRAQQHADGTWTAWLSGGLVAEFDHDEPGVGTVLHDADDAGGYYLTSLQDRSGNVVSVTYSAGGYPGAIDTITDSCHRVATFDLYPAGDVRAGHLASITVPAFNGTTATTTFDLEVVVAPESERRDCELRSSGNVNLPRLTAIHRPLGITTSVTYNELMWDRMFEVSKVFLPTGALIAYTYGEWEWAWQEQFNQAIADRIVGMDGVVQVDKFADGDPSNLAPANHARWQYRRGGYVLPYMTGAPCQDYLAEGPLGSPWGRVSVVAPDGNMTRHQFVLMKPGGNPIPRSLASRAVVQRVFEGECEDWTCDGIDECATREVKRVVTEFQSDDGGALPQYGDRNVRQAGQTTWVRDGAGAWARTTESICAWAGFGHYGETTTTATGTLAHDPTTTRVAWTPDPSTWIFDTWTAASDVQAGTRVSQEARFDQQTGLVNSERAVAALETDAGPTCPLSPSASEPPDLAYCLGPLADCDIVTTPAVAGSAYASIAALSAAQQASALPFTGGDVRTDYARYTTGEGQGRIETVTRSRPAMSLTALVVDTFTWESGAAQTRSRVGLTPAWFSFKQDVDLNTGLPLRRYDTSELATSFEFDALGRLTKVSPPDVAPTLHEYPTPTRYAARAIAADGESADYYRYDGLGRLLIQERTQADGSLSFRSYELDSSGRRISEGRWKAAGTSIPWGTLPAPDSSVVTSYWYASSVPGVGLVQDPLGRVQKVTQGTDAFGLTSSTSYSYPSAGGARATTCGLNLDPLSCVSSLSITNGLGQLVSVTPDQPGGASAVYEYDVLGEMSRATLTGQASGQTFTQLRTWLRNGLGQVTASTDPESGLSEFLDFDIEGNLIESRDANGAAQGYTLRRSYDAAGRMLRLSKESGAGSETLSQLSYDGTGSSCAGAFDLGKLTGESVPLPDFNGSYTRCVRYDGRGGRASATRVSVAVDGGGTTSFEDFTSYDDRGSTSVHGVPTNVVDAYSFEAGAETWHYTARGWPIESMLTGFGPYYHVDVTGRAPSGVPTLLAFSNGTTRYVDLDPMERVARVRVDGMAGSLWDGGTYRYDGIGNIVSMGVEGSPGTHPESFQHDVHGRLVLAHMPASDISYAYDGFGNMTGRIGTPWPSPAEGGFSNRVHFAAATHDNRIHDAGFAFDGNGNMTASPSPQRSYSWDVQGRLRSLTEGATTLGTYAYDSTGERLLQRTPTETRFYFRGVGSAVEVEYVLTQGEWQLSRTYGSSAAAGEWVYVDGSTMGQPTYYGTDHLGTPRVLTDSTGTADSVHLYEPFGLETVPIPSGTNSHQFTGHERDIATGVDYMHARYFMPSLGRFVSSDDPLSGVDYQAPQSWNRYAYVNNGPTGLVDEDGHEAIADLASRCAKLS